MNFEQAKKIDIVYYLSNRGYKHDHIKGDKTWYLSPLSNERTASFNVNTSKNVWYCFSIGDGGTIIDLVMQLNNCDKYEALNHLTNHNFSFHQPTKVRKSQLKECEIDRNTHLHHPVLLNYLRKRSINLSVAKNYCRELHYRYKLIADDPDINTPSATNGHYEKLFFTIGFENDLGGFEHRNSIFKGCIYNKAITSIENNSNTLSLFEGFMDFLSYLTLKKRIPQEDFVILNSTTLVEKTLPILQDYDKIKVFFDNDESGKKALKCIQENGQKKIIDCSIHYSKHNDLNEYLIAASNESR